MTTPLPGSVPYDNKKPVLVPRNLNGASLVDFLCGILPHIPRAEWESLCRAGRLVTEDGRSVEASRPVQTGERYHLLQPGIVEPEIRTDLRILYEDEALIVLEKPAPLPVHPSGRFNRNTLQYILHQAYAPQKPRAAHRLDANTTGLMVCTRTRHFAGLLQPQFARGEVDKVYLVRIQGQPEWDNLTSDAPIRDHPGEGGTREVDYEEGLSARTEFQVVERREDGTTLLEARLFTGRTNQIRVHLWDLGFPVCGDPVYRPGRQLGTSQTLTLTDPPLCLHAWKLAFNHPLTKDRVGFEGQRPAWSAGVELLM
jgi:RluA family pseudouridine synthase